MKKKFTVVFKIELPVCIEKNKGWFIASCPLLDVVTQGKTRATAKKNIADALELFLMSCFERGTLVEVLKGHGFVPEKNLHHPATNPFPGHLSRVKVPFPFNVPVPEYVQCPA